MKLKNCLKLFGFILMLLAGGILSNVLYKRVVMGDTPVMRTQNQFEAFDFKIDTLILGDSHPQHALDTRIIKNSFNYTAAAESYILTYYKLKYILDNHLKKIDTIILNIDPHSFTSARSNQFPIPYNYYYVKYVNYLELGKRKNKILPYLYEYIKGTFFSFLGSRRDIYKKIEGKEKKIRLINGYVLAKNDFSKMNREKIAEKGGEFFLGNPVTGIKKEKNFILTLADGVQLEAPQVLLSAGPWTRDLAKLPGLDLPFYPERHEAVITERVPKFFEPMIVDYRSDGCYFHQLISGQVIACYTPVPNVPGIHEDVTFDFLPQVARRMSRLVPELKKASILRNWSGSYTMTPDGNPIVDQSDIDGLYIASGMSGHGFMFGPAIGKHLAHFMLTHEWDADFSEFSGKREFKSKESMK